MGPAGEVRLGVHAGPGHPWVLALDQRARLGRDGGVARGQQEAVVEQALEAQGEHSRLGATQAGSLGNAEERQIIDGIEGERGVEQAARSIGFLGTHHPRRWTSVGEEQLDRRRRGSGVTEGGEQLGR